LMLIVIYDETDIGASKFDETDYKD
jgi:hypothetical protein